MPEPTPAQTTNRTRVRIFINDNPFFAPESTMTGSALLALAGLPAGNHLFLEVPGPSDDRQIGTSEPFELHSGMKFYDVPVGTFG